MKQTTARKLPALRLLQAKRLRARADLPALHQRPALPLSSPAENDFLVPNPRPDLTLDPQTLRMIEVG